MIRLGWTIPVLILNMQISDIVHRTIACRIKKDNIIDNYDTEA